jgi:hypothetical protein
MEGGLEADANGIESPMPQQLGPAASGRVYVFPMTFAQQRLWLLESLDANSLDTRIAALEMLTASEKSQRGVETRRRKQSQLPNLMAVQPEAVSLPVADRRSEKS